MLKYAESTLTDLIRLATEGRLYAVLDACDEPSVLYKIQELGAEGSLCLFRGAISQEMQAIAPYLVLMDEPLLVWLQRALWLRPWGIFIVSGAQGKAICGNLRKFLTVRGPTGEPLYFRYYDPRILPTFLSNCDEGELEKFFGPIEALGWCPTASTVRLCWRKPGPTE